MGSAGLLVDPASHIPIAEAMARVLSDRGIQHRARQAGPDRAARFRWENTARQVEALLAQLA
ncbi:MAG: glycosyltransferase family 4 protein [Synechococcus sp. SB0678_bin_12]|nr:glycosyltransferase family 4 protein [Synechococcus sp. SB0678_bin_12]